MKPEEPVISTEGVAMHGAARQPDLLSTVLVHSPPHESVPPSFESFDGLGQADKWSIWIRNSLELHWRPVFLQPLGRSGFLPVCFKASQLGIQLVERDMLPLARRRLPSPATQRVAQTLDRLDHVFSQCWDQPHVSTKLGIH